MGLALILIGLIVMLLVHFTIGLVLIVIGIILLFVPNTAGYSDYRHRRRVP